MDTTEDKILEALKLKSGNVTVVAQMLGLSPSYVSRIKRRHLRDLVEIPETTVQLPAEQNREARDLLPPDLQRVGSLRDKVIDSLMERTDFEQMETKDSIKLLDILLRYETRVNHVAKPMQANIFQDNRSQVLIDQLEDLTPEQIRALAGAPKPIDLDIVDGKVINPNLEDDYE